MGQLQGSFGTAPLTRLDGVDLSVTTFTSLGSGGLQPASEAARALVTL